MTEMEKRDETFKRQRAVLELEVKMKVYANGLAQPGSSNFRKPIHEHLYKRGPVLALTVAKKNTAGRNNSGKITVRARGGGHRRRVRLVDSYRLTPGKQEVVRIEYDPNRSGHIALVRHLESDHLLYILAPYGLRAGDVVESFRAGIPADFLAEMKQHNYGEVDEALLNARIIQRGNCLPLHMMPVGLIIHNIGLRPGGRGQLVKAAGTFGKLLSKDLEKQKVVVRLSLGEHRYVDSRCHATLGIVLNKEHRFVSWGKAGRARHRGFRPKVRGVAMNAHDHPHGGGRGKSKSGKVLQSMWGLKKFEKTRIGKHVNKWVVEPRVRKYMASK